MVHPVPCGQGTTRQPTDVPVLEEAWIEVEPGLEPLDVEVEGEGDAEVAVVDLEHVRDVQLHLDQVRLRTERDVHARVVPECTIVVPYQVCPTFSNVM